MRFVEIINRKKFFLLSTTVFLYLIINLLHGERGLISYYKNKNIKEQLASQKKQLISEINFVEKKNSLLTEIIDLDYLETLYRQKFMVGKSSEKVFFNKN